MDFSSEFMFEENAYNVSLSEENAFNASISEEYVDRDSSRLTSTSTQEEECQEMQESLEITEEFNLSDDNRFAEESFSNEALHTIVLNKARAFFESKAKSENKLSLNHGFLQYEKFYADVLKQSFEFLGSQCEAIQKEESNFKHKLDQIDSMNEYLSKTKEVFKKFLDSYIKDNESNRNEYFLLVQKVSDLSLEVDKKESEYLKQIEDKNKELEEINNIRIKKSQEYDKILADLQVKLDAIRTDMEEKENLCVENEKKLQLIEQSNLDAKNKIDKLTMEYNNNVENLKKINTEITEMKIKIQDVKSNKRNEALKTKIEFYEQKHNDYLQQEAVLRNKIECNKTVISEKTAKKESLEVEITELQLLHDEKAQSLEEVNKKILNLEKTNAEKKNELLQKKCLLEINLNKVTRDYEDLNRSLLVEEESKTKRSEKIAELKKTLGEVKEENLQLTETLNQQNLIMESEKLEMETLENKILDIEVEIDNIKNQDKILQESHELKVKEAQEKYDQLEKEFEEAKSILLSENNAKLEKLKEEASNKETTLKNEEQTLLSESNQIKKQLEDKQKELKAEIDMLEGKKKLKTSLVGKYELLKQRKQALTKKKTNDSQKIPGSKINTIPKTGGGPKSPGGGILKSPGTPKTTPTKSVTFKRALSPPMRIASSCFEDLLKSSLENIKNSKLTSDQNSSKRARRFDPPERDA